MFRDFSKSKEFIYQLLSLKVNSYFGEFLFVKIGEFKLYILHYLYL